MILRSTSDLPRSVVLDGSALCEVLHPERDPVFTSLPYSLAHAIVPEGEATLPHRLLSSREVYVIVSGTGRVHAGTQESEVGVGAVVLIEQGEIQWIENTGPDDLVFYVIVDPHWKASEEELVG